MIIKELGDFTATNKFTQAGRNAEQTMAFYLRRAFGDDKKVAVFNNLRLEKEGDAAQIDHLIVHPCGFIIVESKSVTTRLKVNELGEWSREVDGNWQGIESPVLQAKRQSEFLQKILKANVEKLLGKLLGLQVQFSYIPIDLLVAISDTGIIDRPNQNSLPEVCKADQATDRIVALIKKYRKANSFLSLNIKDSGHTFTEEEFSKINQFLLAQHKPLKFPTPTEANTVIFNTNPKAPIQPKAVTLVSQLKVVIPPVQPKAAVVPPQAKPVAPPLKKPTAQESPSKHLCGECQSPNLTIEYGFSYYFKCQQCNGNTTISTVCSTCGGKERIRKSKLEFFAECKTCGTSNLFHTNPAEGIPQS